MGGRVSSGTSVVTVPAGGASVSGRCSSSSVGSPGAPVEGGASTSPLGAAPSAQEADGDADAQGEDDDADDHVEPEVFHVVHPITARRCRRLGRTAGSGGLLRQADCWVATSAGAARLPSSRRRPACSRRRGASAISIIFFWCVMSMR